jgi:hypothetical protein
LPQSVERNLLRNPPPLGSMIGYPQASLIFGDRGPEIRRSGIFLPLFSR